MKRSHRAGLISEQAIKEALTDAKGDIFLASTTLDCTAQELDRYIRASGELQGFAAAIEKVKIDPAYSRMSAEQFENEIADLTRAFKVVGLEELHELATMNHGNSAAMAKVKLQAAIALRGGHQQVGGDREIEHALSELNTLYHQNAQGHIERRSAGRQSNASIRQYNFAITLYVRNVHVANSATFGRSPVRARSSTIGL